MVILKDSWFANWATLPLIILHSVIYFERSLVFRCNEFIYLVSPTFHSKQFQRLVEYLLLFLFQESIIYDTRFERAITHSLFHLEVLALQYMRMARRLHFYLLCNLMLLEVALDATIDTLQSELIQCVLVFTAVYQMFPPDLCCQWTYMLFQMIVISLMKWNILIQILLLARTSNMRISICHSYSIMESLCIAHQSTSFFQSLMNVLKDLQALAPSSALIVFL